MAKIIIASGTTGGHFFPALSLTQSLERQGEEIFFLLSRRHKSWAEFLPKGTHPIFFSGQALPQRFGLGTFSFIFSFVSGLIKSFFILLRLKPQAAVGFGSYLGAPLIFISAILRVPVLIHEQNFMPGRATRFLGPYAKKIAISFKESNNYFARALEPRIVFTGNPVRQEILEADASQARIFFGLGLSKFTLLVIGGSQGAHFLNEIMIESLGSFSAEEKEKIQIIHLCGKADYQWLNQQYQRLGLEVRIFSFLKEIGFALKAADLVLARSGAATLAEIFACGRPSILVPYNFAGGHQKANAFYACEKGAALTFNEERLSPSLLKENLLRLMEEQQLREKMAKQALELAKPDATSCLSKEVLNMLGNN